MRATNDVEDGYQVHILEPELSAQASCEQSESMTVREFLLLLLSTGAGLDAGIYVINNKHLKQEYDEADGENEDVELRYAVHRLQTIKAAHVDQDGWIDSTVVLVSEAHVTDEEEREEDIEELAEYSARTAEEIKKIKEQLQLL